MKSLVGKEQTQVPLPSQEGTKGVVQYALYVQISSKWMTGTQRANKGTARR